MEGKKAEKKRKREEDTQKEPEIDDRSALILRVKGLVADRDAARANSSFTEADRIRSALESLGVETIDQKNGPSGWKFKDGSSKKLPAGAKIPEGMVKKSKTPQTAEDNNAPQQKKAKKAAAPSAVATAEAERSKNILNAMKPKVAANQRNVQGVLIEEVNSGAGPKASGGDRVKVYYTGRLKSNNKVFDSSTKKPFTFTLGKGEVIRGWDIGIQGMSVGCKRMLTIPPEKAYGRTGSPPVIPGNATLIFEVVLLEIIPKKQR